MQLPIDEILDLLSAGLDEVVGITIDVFQSLLK